MKEYTKVAFSINEKIMRTEANEEASANFLVIPANLPVNLLFLCRQVSSCIVNIDKSISNMTRSGPLTTPQPSM